MPFRKHAKQRLHLANLRAIKQQKMQEINANKPAAVDDDAQDYLDNLGALAEKFEAEALTVDEAEVDDIAVEDLSKPQLDLHAPQQHDLDENSSTNLQALNARFYHLYVHAVMKAEDTKLAEVAGRLYNPSVKVRVNTDAAYRAAREQFNEEHPLANIPLKITVLRWFRNMNRHNAMEPAFESKGVRSAACVERVTLLLRDQPNLSCRQIIQDTGMGKSTVYRIVQALTKKGIIAPKSSTK